MERYVLGMDIGGTNIRAAMQRESGGTEHFVKLPRESVLGGDPPVEALAGYIESYTARYAGGRPPAAVAIGFPATVDAARRRVLQAPNIPGLDGLPVADELEGLLRVPVHIEKDVNLLFYSDMADLGLPAQGVGIGVYVGTGIGNAIFLNGEPLPGKNGVSGELGHLPRAGGREKCGCGNTGCSECYASGWRLVQLRDQYFPDTELPELFTRFAPAPELAAYVDEIACAVAAEINILDPEYIVLGGGVLNMKDFPMEALKAGIYRHTRKPYPAESLSFYQSKDQAENGVRGALALGWKKLTGRRAGPAAPTGGKQT